jgi:arginyl-tRNA synthetase
MTAKQYIEQQLLGYLKRRGCDEIEIILDKPKLKKFGDFSSNLPMQLAGKLQKNPREIAVDIINSITNDSRFLEKIEIAGPGFINFFITEASLYNQMLEILALKEDYGRSSKGNGTKTLIEFISANPTGPLTIGHGRQAVLGDTIARLMEAIGYHVTREYYFNNAGRQMRILADSVRLRYHELLGEKVVFPEDYYQGDYIIDIAKQIVKEKGDTLKSEKELDYFKNKAETEVFKDIRKTIKRLKFKMDVYYNEQSLYDNKKIDEVVVLLKEKGLVAERDGAAWFLTTKLGKDQDRVIIKSSGEPTYRLPDIAYHREKFERGFELIIDIFGADHIDTYPDVLMAIHALGYDDTKIKVLIHQFVTLTEGAAKIKMSTRKANFVTLDELMDEVGEDVTRFFFLTRHMNSHLNFDLTLAKSESDENPVYYLQYAHARICSIIRLSEEKGIKLNPAPPLSLLTEEDELRLMKHLLEFTHIIEESALSFEPHRLVNHLLEIASYFHRFYTTCRVISDDPKLTQARLALCACTRIVLANGCKILGINAPRQM